MTPAKRSKRSWRLFEFGLLPKISGLYSKEMLASTNLAYAEPEIDCVFLSHAHFDHITHIEFLDPTMPVCMGVGTKLFLESMEETGYFADYGEHPCNKFRTGHKIKIDNLIVEPIAVDHSIPAAYGFIIHTSEGAVVYTGDLRRHGPRKDLTENFLEKAKEVEPVALICEGTRMAVKETRQNYSEPQVKQLGDRIVASTDKAVFTMHANRDIDRLNSFFEEEIADYAFSMVDLCRPCDACGNFVGGGFYHCPKCQIYFCFYCTIQLPTIEGTIKRECPMCGGEFE